MDHVFIGLKEEFGVWSPFVLTGATEPLFLLHLLIYDRQGKLHKEKLHNLYSSPSIIGIMM
jgi:hypothetical protein